MHHSNERLFRQVVGTSCLYNFKTNKMKNIKLIASFLILGFTSLSTYTIDWNDNEGHHNVQSTHHAESVFINGQYLSNWYYYTDTETLDTIHFRPNAEEWHSKRNE